MTTRTRTLILALALALTLTLTRASRSVIFLVVSNQNVLQYLNTLQLRTLFALLVAACSSTAALCIDLNDPFRGSFKVDPNPHPHPHPRPHSHPPSP